MFDLPPGTGDIHLSIMQSLPVTGAVVVSTPHVLLPTLKKGVSMFLSEAINVPVLGIIENMAYFTPEELPDNKYYFGQEGAKNLAEDLEVPFLEKSLSYNLFEKQVIMGVQQQCKLALSLLAF
jgi:ATP-binding protein involved in chromosome partitioning